MARSLVARAIVAATGAQPVWREGVETDNGNWILDVHGLSITEPLVLERELNQIPGVVSVGLFARRPADGVIVCREPPTVLRPRTSAAPGLLAATHRKNTRLNTGP